MGGLRTTKALTLLLSVCGKMELSIQDDCVLWDARVVIPQQGRQQVMSELHAAHPDINRMKGLLRSYVWWPGMDSDLENLVHKCTTFREHQHAPVAAPLHPDGPWKRIHVDCTVPFKGETDAFGSRRCLFQMVRSCHREADDLNSDHSEAEEDFCAAWASGHVTV